MIATNFVEKNVHEWDTTLKERAPYEEKKNANDCLKSKRKAYLDLIHERRKLI